MLDQVDGIRDTKIQLQAAGLEARKTFDSSLHHGMTKLGGEHIMQFVGRPGSGDELDLGKSKLACHRFYYAQMTPVNRVKSASQEADVDGTRHSDFL